MDSPSLLQQSHMPEPDPFRCEVHETTDAAVVALFGELDVASVPEADDAVKEQARSKRRVTVDLRGLSFMDSTGVRMLLEADAASRRDGFTFSIVCGNADVMRVLEITGVLDHLVFIDDPKV